MTNKHVRPEQTENDYFVPNGSYYGQVMDVLEKELPSKYSSSGFRDVLSIRVKVLHSNDETTLFYMVNINWSNQRFIKTLEDLDVLPEKGQEFDPQLLVNMELMVKVINEVKNGIKYSNITEARKAKPEERSDSSIYDQMGTPA